MEHDINPTRVIIDLTDSEEVADKYEKWLSKGIQVVTASKTVGAGPYDRFQAVCKAAAATGSMWASECSVGAALPLINTLKDMQFTGDKIYAVEGVFSGTLTYVAQLMEKGSSLHDALKEAQDKGFTEPDPRSDLSGLDVARKLVILARELGMKISLSDVKIESGITAELSAWQVDAFPDLFCCVGLGWVHTGGSYSLRVAEALACSMTTCSQHHYLTT